MDYRFPPSRVHGSALAALLVSVTSAWCGQVSTAEDDSSFYLMMKHCETSVGFLTSAEAEIKRLQPEPIQFFCSPSLNQKIVCDMQFPEGDAGQKGSQIEFAVLLDMPPSLLLANKYAADVVAIDSVQHSAVVITRLFEDQYAGSKVCHGAYITSHEMDVLLGLIDDGPSHPSERKQR